jgi:hypothetical protein
MVNVSVGYRDQHQSKATGSGGPTGSLWRDA